MLTHDQLAFCILQEYPNLIHGAHFLVGHDLSPETGEQIEPARIVRWSATEAQPTDEELQTLVRKHGKAARAFLAGRDARIERDKRLKVADTLVYKAMDTGDMERMRLAGQYRQALRDVTALAGFPLDFAWPDVPAALQDSLPATA